MERRRTGASRLPLIFALPCLVLSAVFHVMPSIANVSGPRPSNRVVTYFLGSQWHVFDPVTRRDTLMGGVGAHAVYWDTAETSVEYLNGGELYRMRWEMEARPWPVLRLRGWFQDWWFDPEGRCWQAMRVQAVWHAQSASQRPLHRCRAELWQSDSEGTRWRLALAETTECADSNTYPGGWSVADPPGVHRGASVGLGQLEDAMSIDAWGGTPEPIPPPRGEWAYTTDWFYIACRSVPGRGLAFRIRRHPNGLVTFMAPLYLVDRSEGTQQLLDTPTIYRDDELWRMGMEEHDGFLLISGIRTYVFDLRTGEQILSQPNAEVRHAVWIKPPAPSGVDSLGLRRLRERFR
jgi:hypothetical protein